MTPLLWLLAALALFFIGICGLAMFSDYAADYEE